MENLSEQSAEGFYASANNGVEGLASIPRETEMRPLDAHGSGVSEDHRSDFARATRPRRMHTMLSVE